MKVKYFFYGLPVVILSICLFGCKKKPQPKVSNSTYNNAYLYISKGKDIYRNGTGIDSAHNYFIIEADFGDSSDIHAFHESVGNVSINGLNLGAKSPCHYEKSGISDSEMAFFDNAYWKVVSPNGIIDMEYDAGSAAFYKDTVPYIISRAAGFSMKINSLIAPNTDSVRVIIDWQLDKTVSITADSIYFTPSELSVLSPGNNWSHSVIIYCTKQHLMTINGKGFKISTNRQVSYNVSIN